MRKYAISLALAALAGTCGSAAAATIKVGIVAPFSGPFAHYGTLFRTGVEAYVASQGGQIDGHDIEFIFRDTGGPNPALTRTLTQELIVKDKVEYLGGFVFSPNAYAVAPLATQSRTPTVIFNAATSDITSKSPYLLRTSYTLPQVTLPLAGYAHREGLDRIVTAVADYAPGLDAEAAFKQEFTRLGGTVVDSIRMPLKTTDFAPFAQRIKASGAKAVYVFLPGGPPNLGFVKAYNENGLRAAGIELLGTAEADEFDLQKFGPAALGLKTSFHYSAEHDTQANRDFIAALHRQNPQAVANYASVGAWDGMYLIHRMIAATNGQRDGAKAIEAVQGLQWESPRGPVTLDPEHRHVTQDVYLRVVEQDAAGRLFNREVENFGAYDDNGPAANR